MLEESISYRKKNINNYESFNSKSDRSSLGRWENN